MECFVTITAASYSVELQCLQKSIQNKKRGMLSSGIVLHDNARPHTASAINTLLQHFPRAMFDHPPYSREQAADQRKNC